MYHKTVKPPFSLTTRLLYYIHKISRNTASSGGGLSLNSVAFSKGFKAAISDCNILDNIANPNSGVGVSIEDNPKYPVNLEISHSI